MQRKLQTLADRKPQAGAGSIELIFSPIEIQWKDNKLYQKLLIPTYKGEPRKLGTPEKILAFAYFHLDCIREL